MRCMQKPSRTLPVRGRPQSFILDTNYGHVVQESPKLIARYWIHAALCLVLAKQL